MRDHLRRLQEACGQNLLAQDAIDYAVVSGWVALTGDFETDCRAIMADYDKIIEGYQRVVRDHEALQAELYAPLYQQIAA